MGKYLAWLEAERGLRFETYADAWRWSIEEPGAFWQSAWDHFGVRSTTTPGAALADPRMPGARWFPDALINYAEHALSLPGRAPDDVVIVARSQTREPVELTAAALRDAVARCRAGLQRLGVGRGDRVAAYAPNVPEAVIGLLATASLGATWSSCAPEFGTRAVVDRFTQIEPTVLLAVDGYRYGDKAIDRSGAIAEIRAALPSLRSTVVVPYLPLGVRGRRCRAGGHRVVSAARRARAARLHPRPVRPPAVCAVLVGDDGPAQADRPRPRRHPARAPQGARAPHRPRARRPVLLVHDDRLDDVELPGLGPRHRVDPRPVRRQPRVARPVDVVAPRRRHRDDLPRRRCPVPDGVPRGRPATGSRPGPGRAPRRGIDRRAAAGGGLPLGERGGVGRDPARLPERRHGPVHRVPRAVAAGAGLGRRDQLPDARRTGGGVRSRWAVRDRRAGRARDHGADAVDAGRAVGRRRRLADASGLLRAVAAASGVTATG